MTTDTTAVKSVAKALSALDFVLEKSLREPGVGLSEIAAAVGIQATTARNILKTMEECGYLARAEGRLYCPGPKCEQIYRGTLAKRLIAAAERHLRALSDRTGESTVLTTLIGARRQVLMRAQGGGLIVAREQGDAWRSIYEIVTGRVLVSFCSPAERKAQAEAWGAPDEFWPEAAGRLDAVLAEIHAAGHARAVTRGEILALAVPVLDGEGRLLAALGMHLPLFRGDAVREQELLKEMKHCAEVLATEV